ncbi:beta-lactamase family protein [Pseudoxanthomonas daejeonensis]|uniref:serine hydrolase domain-containing protein n=1 Tax=Pseudoxanthomonas daejeonensis TaxID=266062 RepID=UPI001F53EFA1|nr:serine hydrolase domain-containing protein [Pseudoxanthomonas daejeonensis]UNK58689.1 beta-lactamase family protein [Pseudoxanthomonas daejeonensis]
MRIDPRDTRLLASRRRLLGSGLGLLALGAAPAGLWAAPRRDDDADWIPSAAFLDDLPRQMQALGVPGIGIAVVERGALAWSRGFGVTHAQRRTPVTDTTLFEVASLSKPVFAYAVLQLVDRGELSLDRPLVDYVRPEYLGGGEARAWVESISVRDVLRHSTGLPDWRKDPAHEALVPSVKPGTRIDYSGEAFVWLQRVVETVTGESLDATMRRLLFEPAGMRDSSYAWSPALAERSVYGHRAPDATVEPGGSEDMPPQMLREQWSAAQVLADRTGTALSDWRYADAARALPQVQAIAPAGLVAWPADILANAAASLRCTIQDYARFMALMVHDQPAAWELRPATRAAMLARQIEVPGRWTDKGLGWNLESTMRGPVFYHSGSNGGIFKSFALGDVARQRAIVVSTNATNGNVLYRRVVRAATGLDLLAFDV